MEGDSGLIVAAAGIQTSLVKRGSEALVATRGGFVLGTVLIWVRHRGDVA